jgi:YHS domain-containing protein
MVAILVATLIQSPSLVCPVTGAAVMDESPSTAISGIQFRFSDEKSRSAFLSDPQTKLEEARKKGWTVGMSFFDPTTRKTAILSRDGKIRAADLSSIEAFSTYKGIVFPFARARGKSSFDQEPGRFVKEPAKFTLWCPIMLKASASIERAIAYQDIEGVRYYLCCESCVGSARGRGGGPGYVEALAKASDWIVLFPTK